MTDPLRCREGALWESAEVASIGGGGTGVVFQSSGSKQVLPPGRVAASAFASDSEEGPQVLPLFFAALSCIRL